MDLAKRRASLDEAMDARGDWPERSPWLREAVSELPRDLFAPTLLWRRDGHAYVPVDRRTDPEGWAEELYGSQDAPAVTQVSGGQPSSSLSAQGVVVDMLDSLRLEPGHRVWDVGGGQGWNAALAAWRAGPGRVVSTEIDPELAAFARDRLATVGLGVEVLTADATTTPPDGGRFDRVIAAYAVERVPWTWIEATRPGGRIVHPWGRLGHVALTVAEDGRSASGRVRGLGRFMADRNDPVPAAFPAQRRGPADVRELVARDPAPLHDDRDLRFALRVAVPDAVLATGHDEHGATVRVHDGAASWASFSAVDGGRTVLRQGGARRIGDEVLLAWSQWESLGRPEPGAYGLTVTGEGQFAWLNDPHGGVRWPSGAPAPDGRGATVRAGRPGS
ncbi:methyltransferase domain-containing protein [Kitasatospora sp. NPDC056184]|uniref:methyltransferase domain-containing protein n=1 Tax=Kitasatospora sp. NPDC056184 TaxID=3345738 RepID=UPI0035DA3E1A